MPTVLAYHRPSDLDEAAGLLDGTSRRAIGGGTVIVPQARIPSDDGVELVDLQGLGLDSIAGSGDTVEIGAMVRLGELATADDVPPLLRDLAKRELPSALRNQATVGGTVALGDGESVLLAGLLAHDASVAVHGHGSMSLVDYLAGDVSGVVTSVCVDSTGSGSIAATGRTPADVPIVAAIARASGAQTSVALTGVAASPVLVDPGDPTAGLEPPADFRGSSEYRTHLVATLVARVVEEVNA